MATELNYAVYEAGDELPSSIHSCEEEARAHIEALPRWCDGEIKVCYLFYKLSLEKQE